jgi:hypothetical protein
LGVSYYKLLAPLNVSGPGLPLSNRERKFVRELYENGMGEFYARNDLHRFGRVGYDFPEADATPDEHLDLPDSALVLVGGGKDSLVSITLVDKAGINFTPFAVNPKGPIYESITRLNRIPVFVTRLLDQDMVALANDPRYYNGHVPATAINSMIAALASLLYGHNRIVLSNERSASEGNTEFDGRIVNHQFSKSWEFEQSIAGVLDEITAGALDYFSMLRPYSEARIAELFASTDRFDDVFSSCNRNFTIKRNQGPLWCGECPKCHFVFLIFAPFMDRGRLTKIFGQNLFAKPENLDAFRELTGLIGHKPWECVGEILEAAACVWALRDRPDWATDPVVAAMLPELESFYGSAKLQAARAELMSDSPVHKVPDEFAEAIRPHAL